MLAINTDAPKRSHRLGPCVYALTLEPLLPKVCPFNYECFHCQYDQWVEAMEAGRVRPATTAAGPNPGALPVS